MKKILAIFLAVMGPLALPLSAQNLFQRFDSVMTEKYRKGDIDTAYIMRPRTKWTVKARFNLSGATIESEGIDNGQHFKSEMTADYKSIKSYYFAIYDSSGSFLAKEVLSDSAAENMKNI